MCNVEKNKKKELRKGPTLKKKKKKKTIVKMKSVKKQILSQLGHLFNNNNNMMKMTSILLGLVMVSSTSQGVSLGNPSLRGDITSLIEDCGKIIKQ